MTRSELCSAYDATISQRYSSSDALAPTKILMLHTAICKTTNMSITSCHSIHTSLNHFPWIQTTHEGIIFSLLKHVFMHIINETGLLAVITDCILIIHSCNTFDTRCFLLYPGTTFVSKSAGLSSHHVRPVNGSHKATN